MVDYALLSHRQVLTIARRAAPGSFGTARRCNVEISGLPICILVALNFIGKGSACASFVMPLRLEHLICLFHGCALHGRARRVRLRHCHAVMDEPEGRTGRRTRDHCRSSDRVNRGNRLR